jgi:hypothetical protein
MQVGDAVGITQRNGEHVERLFAEDDAVGDVLEQAAIVELFLGERIISQIVNGGQHYVGGEADGAAVEVNGLIGQKAESFTGDIFAGVIGEDLESLLPVGANRGGDEPLRSVAVGMIDAELIHGVALI